MIHQDATIKDPHDDEYVYVPLTRSELEQLVEIWEFSDERYTHDVSIQLKAAGGLAQLDAMAARKTAEPEVTDTP